MATTTKKLEVLRFFVPINREAINEKERIVEGVAFANPKVASDEYELTVEAMRDATPDYMEWGAVRRMHQSHAAGTARSEARENLGVEWSEDDKAVIRCYVSDDQDWKNVVDGVYKGFSVGVVAREVRGKKITRCTWIETSLVDRPADPDAKITSYRSETLTPEEGPFDCEVVEDEASFRYDRGAFLEKLEDLEKDALAYMALDEFFWTVRGIQYSGAEADEKAEALRECAKDFVEYLAPIISRAELLEIVGKIEADTVEEFRSAALNRKAEEGTALELNRIDLEADKPTVVADGAEGAEERTYYTVRAEDLDELIERSVKDRDERAALERDLDAAKKRIERLEQRPAQPQPVRYPGAVEPEKFRSSLDGNKKADEDALQEELARLNRLSSDRNLSATEKSANASRITQIKTELRAMGVEPKV